MATITIDTLAADDVVNATEHGQDLTISGTSVDATPGGLVAVTVNGDTYFTLIEDGGSTWSLVVPGAVISSLADGYYTVHAQTFDVDTNEISADRQLLVITAPPVIAIATIAGDNAINAAEHGAAVTVTGTASGADGATVTVGLGMQTYTGTVTSGHWSVVLPQGVVAGLADGSQTITADVTDAFGNAALQASSVVTVASQLPTLSIGSITSDDIVTASEAAAGVSIGGSVSGADGSTVTVTIGTQAFTATAQSGAWSVSLSPHDIGSFADGQTTVRANVSDAYGNPANEATRSLLVAQTPPTVTIDVIGGDDVINAAEQVSALTVSGTAVGAEGQVVSLVLNDTTYTATVGGGLWSVLVPGPDALSLVDAQRYTVTADVSDVHGNAAIEAARTLGVHTTIPTTTLLPVGGTGVINLAGYSGTPLDQAVVGSGVGATSVTVTLNGHSYTSSAFSHGNWTASIPRADILALSDGSYTVTATTADAWGNSSAAASASLLVDTAPPGLSIGTVAGDDAIDAAEHGAAVSVSGTASGADGQAVSVTLGGFVNTATVVDGSWSTTFSQGVVRSLADGAYSLSATVSDVAGNLGSASRNLVVAATLPGVSVDVVAADNVINAAEHGAALTVSGTATIPNGSTSRPVTVTLGSHSYTTTTSGGVWSLVVPRTDVAALEDGTYAAVAAVSDEYGNVAPTASQTVLVAAALPVVTIDPIAGDGVINLPEHAAAVRLSGTATGANGQAVTVSVNDRSYTAVVSDGAWTATMPQGDVTALQDLGRYSVVAMVTDLYGNAAQPASRIVGVNLTVPTLAIGAIAGDGIVNAVEHGAALAVGGTSTGAVGGTVTVAMAGHSYTATADVNGAWSVTVPQADVTGLADGSYRVTADVMNGFGTIADTAAVVLLVDTVAQAPGVSLAPGSTAEHATLAGTAEALAQVSVSLGGQVLGTTTAGGDGAWRYDVPSPVSGGVNSVTATQMDGAGNLSAASTAVLLPRAGSDFATAEPDFDAPYYVQQNPDVAASGMDPLLHYQTFGWHEGRNPNALFNTTYYLNQNPDVAAAAINPLLHYEMFGWMEGRNPSALFNTSAYLSTNPDVAAATFDPLSHYLRFGQTEGRMTFAAPPHATGPQDPLVDAAYYYAHNPAVAAAGMDATAQFNSAGWQQGANPDAYFDVGYYLAHNPDVAAAGINPLLHYEFFGWTEGRDPSASFSTRGYLNANPDVAAAHFDPLQHYLQYGQSEGRAIIPV